MKFDRYTIQSRIQPALLTVLPLGLLVLAWLSTSATALGVLWGLLVTGGGTAFLAQVGRDLGRKKQPKLFKSWGGPPATRLLRYRSSANRNLLTRRRQKLEGIVGRPLPTEQAETNDPITADQEYESAVAYLLEATRDHERFPLILAENINYGFRRNLWGMKPYGIAISVVAVAGALGLVVTDLLSERSGLAWLQRVASAEPEVVLRLSAAVLTIVILLGWILIVRPTWVKAAAEAYADRLISAIDSL